VSWEFAVVARLMASPAVFALTGENIEWDDRAPDAPLPAITLQLITDGRTQTNDGIDAFSGDRVQVNSLARTKREAVLLREAVIAALIPAGEHDGVTFLESFIDGGGSDAERPTTDRICRERTDLIIWHN
jgi:Protein of unknown function (DUF3168)